MIAETSRLRMRELVEQDAKDIFLLNSDPDVVKFTGDSAFESVEAAREFIMKYADYRLYKISRWGLFKKFDDQFIGWCGLKYHPDDGSVDLGFRLLKNEWNQGYATEAAKACLELGFEQRNYSEIIARVFP